MRIAILCLLCAPLFTRAEVKNPLTAKEIQDGWLLLFDGNSTFGWQTTKGGWTVQNNLLTAPGKLANLTSTSAFLDYEIHVEYEIAQGGSLAMVTHANDQGESIGRIGELKFFRFPGLCRAKIKVYNGRAGSGSFGPVQGRQGAGFGGGSDGAPRRSAAHLAFRGHNCTIKSIKLKPTSLKSIFNGKNLDGWKIHPGRKSKFTVKNGVLHVKDGNGDLQTKGQWADFVLQLECKVNGKNLNSGIFFRCIPDKYQQGYESQIHNGFDAKTKKTYTLQQYDPQTNKPSKKIKVTSTAKDYGSGGIYRRQPARFQAAKDGEWFTMTVLAHGRHISTWVNGLQVADWTDHRPLKDNARQGCRLKKGAISIQGHDPTTDLSFRNFRILNHAN